MSTTNPIPGGTMVAALSTIFGQAEELVARDVSPDVASNHALDMKRPPIVIAIAARVAWAQMMDPMDTADPAELRVFIAPGEHAQEIADA